MKMKNKLLCLLFAVLMLITLSTTAFAVSETNNGTIKIEVETDKDSYQAWGVAEITATITNVSSGDINNVTAQAVFDDLAPANKRGSETSKSVDVLKAGESFSFSYKATLDKDEHNLNIFQKIILFFVRLFNGGYNADNNTIDVVAECVTEIEFGKFTAENVVQVGYVNIEDDNSDDESVINAFTEYFDVKKEINAISDKYENDNGYISENDVKSVISEIAEYAEQKLQQGLIQDYGVEIENNCIWITLKNGIDFIYMPNIEGIDSVDISSYQPCLFTYGIEIQERSKEATDGSAEKIEERIGYNFINNFDNQEITLDTIKNIGDNEIIIWHGHGVYTTKHHSCLMTNIELDEVAFLFDPIYYLSEIGYTEDYLNGRIVCTADGYVCVTYKFFEEYLNSLDNTFIYLGTCSSGKDSVLADTFIAKGAETVVANTDIIHTYYNLDMIESICTKMTEFSTTTNKYYTVGEALVLAKEEHGKFCCEEHINTEARIWENSNYRFSENSCSLLTGTVTDEETGEPISDVLVQASLDDFTAYTATTDENGQFELAVPDSLYELEFSHEDYEEKRFNHSAIEDTELNVSLNPLHTVSGTVTLNSSGVPVEKAGVSVYDPESEYPNRSILYTETDENGNYSFQLPSGKYVIEYSYTKISSDSDDIVLYSVEKELTIEKSDCKVDVALIPGNDDSIEDDETEDDRTITDSGACGDKVTWTLYEDGRLIISGSGKMRDYSGFYSGSTNTPPWYTYSNNIKSLTIENGVTSIGSGAFYHCTNLINLSLSDTLTSIGIYAFNNCTNLANFKFGKGLTYIYDYAFQNCDSLTNITIPSNITTIGTSAFYGCDGIVDVVIEKGITHLGSVFSYCTSLRNITIPDSVTTIDGTFTHCTQLEKIVIPDSVTTINSAFSGCIGLKSVTIGKNVTTIGSNAFSSCSGLQSVTIPDSVTLIDERAFYRCSGLSEIAIPDSVTKIGNYAFYLCTGAKKVVIGNNVKNIGSYAFQSCTGLSDLTIGNSVVNIGSYAFQNCTGIKEIIIPDSVATIGQYSFQNCTGAKNLELGNGVSTIETYAFSECIGLTNIDLGNNVTNISSYAFNNCDGIVNVTIPNSVTVIGQYAFYGCDGLDTVSLGNGISILNYTFSNCVSLKNITIPDSVTNINGAFNNCISLRNITIPNSVTNINGAFSGCTQLEEIIIPDSVTTINSAFTSCKSLKRVTIGPNVTTIGDSAFSGCVSLQKITIPENVTTLGYKAFCGCVSLTEIVIPDSVITIGSYAFSGCSGAKKLIIGNGVKTIGVYSFQGCIGISDLTIGKNVTTIYNHTFIGCTGIKEITIPVSVIRIDENAFKDCIGISKVYYKGSEAQWQQISIGSSNDYLTNATIHYNA